MNSLFYLQERPQILKFATLGFVILQIVGLVLFSIFFTIQWNAEHTLPPVPEPAMLASSPMENSTLAAVLPKPSLDRPEVLQSEENDSGGLFVHIIPAQEPESVTRMPSENVLPAPPDINDNDTAILMSSTTPLPVVSGIPATTTNTPTTTPPSTTSKPEPMIPPKLPARLRLPHNQLVSLVLQMCFAVFNGIGSVVYVIVLALYMLKL